MKLPRSGCKPAPVQAACTGWATSSMHQDRCAVNTVYEQRLSLAVRPLLTLDGRWLSSHARGTRGFSKSECKYRRLAWIMSCLCFRSPDLSVAHVFCSAVTAVGLV